MAAAGGDGGQAAFGAGGVGGQGGTRGAGGLGGTGVGGTRRRRQHGRKRYWRWIGQLRQCVLDRGHRQLSVELGDWRRRRSRRRRRLWQRRWGRHRVPRVATGSPAPVAQAAPAASATPAWAARSSMPTSGTLTIAPRLGTKKGSKQSKATDTITANQANGGPAGLGGAGGGAAGGQGQAPGGTAGQAFPGTPGVAGVAGAGIGGGLELFPGGHVTIDNTNITGNTASTSEQRRRRDVLDVTNADGTGGWDACRASHSPDSH